MTYGSFFGQWRAAIAALIGVFGLLCQTSLGYSEPLQVPALQIIRTPMVTGWPTAYPASSALLDPADRAIFEEAYEAANRRDWPRARSLGARVKHPVAKKFIHWVYLSADNTEPTFEELVQFLEANPHWPSQPTLFKKAEIALPELMPPQQLIAWFAGQEPVTGEGMVRLGKALIATGKVEYGTSWIRRAFAEHNFTDVRQREIFTDMRRYLDTDTIDRRLEHLLWTSQHHQAEWLMTYASADRRRVAEARVALMRSRSNALGIVNGLSADERGESGVLFDEIRYLRRRGDDAAARRIFTRIVKNMAVPYPEKWWIERNVQVRKAMEDRDYGSAYEIARHHGLSEGGAFADAAFLAGWIALRFLNQPKDALAHFEALERGVSFPISLSRAHYWQGRAAQDMGDLEGARSAYERASAFPYTFYGQLAAESALIANRKLELPVGAPIPVDLRGPFFSDELVTAIRLLNEIDGERYLRTLAYHLAGRDGPKEHVLFLAELMRRTGYEAIAVRVAKKASQRHILLTDYLYPVLELPRYRGNGTAPEPALVLGLSRQESEFNPRAVSSAGARGLMQLMPSTAQLTARKHGLPYDSSRLLTDPSYNMQIGMAHLGDLLHRFDGSYIMVFAGYNAGPNRVSQWVAELGDPRTGAIDPIDWIESIPFSETRNYVQRVLENVMVYRHRLAGEPIAFMVSTDLRRTSATPPAPFSALGATTTPTRGESTQTLPPAPPPRPVALDNSRSPKTDAQPIKPAHQPQQPTGTAGIPSNAAAPADTVSTEADGLVMAPIPDPVPENAPASGLTRDPATGQIPSDDYLPPSGRVTMPASPQSGPRLSAAPAPYSERVSPAPQIQTPESRPVSPEMAPEPSWQIPLDCARFVVHADGTGECID